MSSFIETRHGKSWGHIYESPRKRGLVISADGSGEFRSVGMWKSEKLARWWNEHGYSLYVFDKYGCGESEGDWSKVTLNILSEQLEDLCSALKAQTPKLIYFGQSEGSKLGFDVGARSNSVDAFILRVPSHQPIYERLRYQLLERGADPAGWETWEQGLHEIQQDLAAKRPITGFLYDFPRTYWASSLERPQPGDIMTRIKAPLLVLNGGADQMTPLRAFKTIHEKIKECPHPLSRARIYPLVGHSLTKPNQEWADSEAAAESLLWLSEVFEGGPG
jgi:alpha-beta hydrolase superfamily lysophospholipase